MSKQKNVIGRREMLRRVGAGSLAAVAPACGDSGEGATASATPGVTDSPTTTPTGSMPSSTATDPTSPVASPGNPMPSATSPGPTGPTAPGPVGPTASNPGPTGPTAPNPGPSGPTATSAPTGPTATSAGGAGGEANDPGAGGAGGSEDPGAGGAGGGGPTMNGELEVPPWDDVPMCTASRTDGAGQGPFFIHNEEKDDDIDLFRQDIRGQYDPAAEEGIEMHLHLRILDATSDACNMTPVAGVEVYIWHTDGQGYYSGFGEPGDQNPDEPYAGVPNQNDLDNPDRFCRGAQTTDANGVVSFRSIFPGWYNGRDVHIHFVCLQPGTSSRGRTNYSGDGHVFTTQFYFEPDLTDAVHKSREPYLRRTMISAYQGAIQADEANNSGLRAKASFENDLVTAQMQIIVDPAGTAAGGGGGGFGF